jgi:hypothetical protein
MAGRSGRRLTTMQIIFHKQAAPVLELTAEQKPIAEAYLRAVQALRARMDSQELFQAVRDNDSARILAVINSDELTSLLQGEYFNDFRTLVEGEALAAISLLPRSVQQVIRFDPINDLTIQALRDFQFSRIVDITRETADAIREGVTAATVQGIHPTKNARQIQQILEDEIGLTRRQRRAVQNFRTQLEQGDSAALNRRLSGPDKQMARGALKSGDQERIDRVVARYNKRLLRFRANNIARTESVRSAAVGRQLLWQQGVDQGVIDETRARKFWIVHRDELLCKICRPIPKMNPDGVPIGSDFSTPVGDLKHSPAHPS